MPFLKVFPNATVARAVNTIAVNPQRSFQFIVDLFSKS